jgi:protein adenylyltransferase
MALSGETIDFGPCAFMDPYSRSTVFSSIDHAGRYAYGNQPTIAQWNLARLAEATLPLFDDDSDRAVDRATDVLARFTGRFDHHWLRGVRAKLGLFTEESDDKALADELLMWMERATADFTNTFRALTRHEPVPGLEEWRAAWNARLERQPQPRQEVEALMRKHNPAVIPRNHLVERALRAATDDHDLSVLTQLVEVLARPYDHDRNLGEFASPGPRDDRYRTFCGT